MLQQNTGTLTGRDDRIISIDVLRGFVMILMALDHVRDYFHWSAALYKPLDFDHTSVPIFLTRWITHYCAPTFVFLSGTSAYLTVGRKGKQGLSKFLFTRGLWLVLLEFTVISFGWSFMQMFSVIFLQTIWALGISMIALSVLIYLPKRLLLVIALAIIFGHNALDNIHIAGNGMKAMAWSAVHDQRLFTFGDFKLIIAYPVLSWIGVMTAGYCFGEIFIRYKDDQRKKLLTNIGVSCIVIFIALRYSNVYGDQSLWSPKQTSIFTVLSFINTTKYPPSLLYILMTLGPSILFLAFAEKPLGKITSTISVFGRVPMFYYILHIYLIHIAAVVIELSEGYKADVVFRSNILNPVTSGFSLVGVYIVWLSLVALLYP